jgi:hypothetical protein
MSKEITKPRKKEVILKVGWPLLFVPAIYLQVIIHELGHFILGRIAGYRLWSLRIFGFVLERVNGSFSYPPKP